MWKQKFNITPGTSKLDIKGRMGLRDMWYRFCPVDGSEGIFGLLSQRNKSSKTERILRQNIDSDQDCHEEFQRNGDKWYNSPPPISNTQSTGATTKGITGKTKEVIRQSDLSRRVGKEKFHPMQWVPPKVTPNITKMIIREYRSLVVRGV